MGRFDLTEAPVPMRPDERRLVWVTTVVVALSRWWALSRSLWDWDEALFSLALGDFDIAHHHPHPPGFPLYIATARLMRPLAGTDFAALQGVNLLAAAALFPSLVLLFRESRLSFRESFLAALLTVFMPNVWLFGGTGFSDVPTLTLVVLAAALLLRGARGRSSFILGALLLGIAGGFRIQSLVVGFPPAAVATFSRLRKRDRVGVAAGLVLGAVVVAGSYAGAAMATGGWARYADAVRHHQSYIRNVDSFHSENRPGLLEIADLFFLRPFRADALNWVLLLLAATGAITSIVRREWFLVLLAAMFLPFMIMAWLYLDYWSVSRFSIGWIPILTVLAVRGVEVTGEGVAELTSLPFGRAFVWCLSTSLILASMIWTMPALRELRSTISPPVAAMEWARKGVPSGARIEISAALIPFGDYYLQSYDTVPESEGCVAGSEWRVLEGRCSEPGSLVFLRPRKRLWHIVRHRYFEISVVPPVASSGAPPPPKAGPLNER